MRFVIADDHGAPLRWMRRVLTQSGHEVVGEAWNGKQAVDFCQELQPDVAVLDVAMEPMTGPEAARIILRDTTAAHIIFVTSNTQDAARRPLEALGCKVIPKTDEDTFLLRAIAEIHREA